VTTESLESARSGSRRRRIPAEEVRARMLATARDLAMEGEVALSLVDLSMEEVMQRARVPRSSVYRIWPYKEEFVDELLCYLAGPEGYFVGRDVFDPATFDEVRKTIAEHDDLLGTEEGRRAVLCEVVRRGVGRNFEAFHESQAARINLALTGAVGSMHESSVRASIAAALEKAEAASRTTITELIEYVMSTLGLRLRHSAPALGQLVTAGSALIRGLAQRRVVAESAIGDEQRYLGPLVSMAGPSIDGQAATWNLASVAYLGLVDSFLEPDPDFRGPER
jgi:AcrR family transcriptional regulator